MKIPFSPPYVDEDVINEVLESLNSGWITTGPKVKSLQDEVGKLTGIPNVLCVNSWTSGAILILKWFGVKEGDEVIIPAYTYSATALAVLHCGATPVMVDVLSDFSVDPEKIWEAITPKTKIIMPVDFGGWPCDYNKINAIAQDTEIKKLFTPENEVQEKLGRILVVADAAHSIGATFEGKESGSLADITIFSFHAVKNITTAEGGAVCVNLPQPFDNDEVYKKLRLWTLNGQSKDAFTKSQGGGDSWKYDILFQGLKINMPDICAAIGLAQIKKYKNQLLAERKSIAEAYTQFFSDKAWAELPVMKSNERESSYHLFALRFRGISEAQRDAILRELSETEVSANVHFIPMPLLTLFKNLGYSIADFPVAYDNYSREISLPIYPQLTDNEVEIICNRVEEAYLKTLKQ